jgi:hypothetical protein
MLLGYPGRTSRYLPSAAIAQRLEFLYPRRLEIYSDWLRLLEQAGERDEAARLAVASTIKALANRLKNSRGMMAGLGRNQVLERKLAEEDRLEVWVASAAERQEEFGGVIAALNDLYEEEPGRQEMELLLGQLKVASKTFGFAYKIVLNAREREKPDLDRKLGYQDRDQDRLRITLERAQKDLDLEAERAVTAYFFRRARELPDGHRITALDGPPAELEAEVERLYAGTELMDQEARLAALERSREELEGSGDSMVRLALALEPEYDAMDRREETRKGALSRLLPRYSRMLMEHRGRVYPDANGTLRISVATVKGYSPADAVWMEAQTTLTGLLAKETGEEPFASPLRVLAAAREIDPERWLQPGLDDVPLCFLSDADTTGGNSGSPVVDGRGRLVGLNFDRVFENIAGDYGYSPDISRNVSVDVRYFLWMLEKVEEAYPILREVGIEPSPPKPRKGSSRK